METHITKPNHYLKKGKWCIDIIYLFVSGKSPEESYVLGNIIKYLWRYGEKNGLDDLKKAQEYLGMLIELHQKEGK